MQPGAIIPVSCSTSRTYLRSTSPLSVSACSISSHFNRFSVLPEVVLGGTGFVLPVVSRKSRQRLTRRRRLAAAQHISSISISADLGSEDPLTLPCLVNNTLPATCMVDSGASSQFIDLDFALNMDLPLILKKKPEDLVLADGARSKVGQITHTCTVKLTIDQHTEDLTFHVTKLAGWNLIVGKPWLCLHNPAIDWTLNAISFTSKFCQSHCRSHKPTSLSATATSPLSISMISRAALRVAIKEPGAQFFIAAIYATPDDEGEPEEPAAKLVPEEYHEFLPIFSEKEARILPPHRYVDHAIPLEEGVKPPFGRMYSMSDSELKEVRKWIDENLSKSFIRASSSSAASPILFVKKKDGSLRLCVDYRALNDITIKDRHPLPRIEETLNQIRGCKYFTRLDPRACFNQIRIKEGDEWKTAFRTRYGLYEFLVMPFGLTNAPATAQRYVNDTLREFLDIFCVCYIDDILIYSKTLKEHKAQVRKVLQKLKDAGLFVKPEKCEFSVEKTTFLGFVFSEQGLEMDPEKVNAVLNWETPKSVKDIQCFLGFANFYRRFIDRYSHMCQPLFNLLRKDVAFAWDASCDLVFQQLKKAFTSAPVLRHFDPDLETLIETDASDYVVSGILSQKHPNASGDKLVLHPVAFISEKMSPAECNYGIGDKELLAIVVALEKWHIYLHQLPHAFTILTDHHNLQTFTTKALLSRRQARWAHEIAQYDFRIVFRPGVQNGKADALTRRSRDLPEEGDERARPVQALLPPEKFSLSALSTKHDQDIIEALKTDKLAQEILSALSSGARRHPIVPLGECKVVENGLLLVNDLVYVPDNPDLFLRILNSCHDHPAAGHPGQAATYELVSRDYWWPKMRHTIARYVRNCDTCARIKPARHAPYGLLKPLKVPWRRWSSVSLDLITGLPLSQGFDALLVVVECLSKMAHYIPTTTTVDSKGIAKLFFDNVFRLHGIPDSVVSDRGTQFVSEFIRALTSLIGIKQKVSTAFHPQTDGQTERVNAIAEQYLRAYCNYQQDNWSELLTMAEFAYNNTLSATTGLTPIRAM